MYLSRKRTLKYATRKVFSYAKTKIIGRKSFTFIEKDL